MKKNFSILAILMIFSLAIAGCKTDLQKVEVQQKKMGGSFPTCKLNPKAFQKFLTEHLTKEIDCGEQYLKAFTDVVESERPGTLSLDGISTYVSANATSDFDPDMLSVIKSIFQLNAIIYGDHEKFISRENVPKMFKIIRQMNKDFVDYNITSHFSDETNKDYQTHLKRRHEIFLVVERLTRLIKQETAGRKLGNYTIDLSEFMFNMFHKIRPRFVDDWEAIGFLKRAMLGGYKRSLSEIGFQGLLNKASKLAMLVYDISKIESLELSTAEQADRLNLYEQDIKNVKSIIYYPENSKDFVMDVHDIFSAVEYFVPSMFNMRDYLPSITAIKETLFKTDAIFFTAEEVYIGVSHLEEIVSMGKAYYNFYSAESKALSEGFVENKIYENIKPKDAGSRVHFENFKRIIKNYKYFKGDKTLPSYQHKSIRDAKGIFEIGMLEYGMEIIAKKHGQYNETAHKNIALSQKNIRGIVDRISGFLVGEEIIFDGRQGATAETLTLMATLFQNQSDGDDVMSIPELTELAHSLMTASEIADKMHPYLQTKCETDSIGRIETQCFIKEFPSFYNESFKGDEKLSDFFPLMTEILNLKEDTEKEEKRVFNLINRYQQFSRTCPTYVSGEDVYVSKSDLFLLFAGVIGIEQSIIRFDRDQSNSLNAKEVSTAYSIYRAGIEGILKEQNLNILTPYTKKVYKYLIKYKGVPNTDDLKNAFKQFSFRNFRFSFRNLRRTSGKTTKEVAKFMYFLFSPLANRRSSADRLTYTSVLKVISDSSPENSGPNAFNCELLRAK